MSTTINGTNGVTFADASILGSALGIFNRVIDGGFILNQRGYVSGTALSAGTYAHDRWKAGAGGCTYTFTQAAQGVNTTITITAGSLQQVIEGCNMQEGGTYVLTWTGTAQGRWNGGSYASSPLVVTGLTAGSNATIEFNTGTLGSVQIVAGSAPSSFAYRPYGTELALCQRYYELGRIEFTAAASNRIIQMWSFKQTKRVTPTVTAANIIGVVEVQTATDTAVRLDNTQNGVQSAANLTASAEL